MFTLCFKTRVYFGKKVDIDYLAVGNSKFSSDMNLNISFTALIKTIYLNNLILKVNKMYSKYLLDYEIL